MTRQTSDFSQRTAQVSALVLVLLALEVVGCGRLFTWGKEKESDPLSLDSDPIGMQVVPRSNKDVADLSADDVVRVMQRVGFTDEQILHLGPDLHAALLKSGAAGIVIGKRTEAVFAVNGGHLFIRSRSGADFVYNLASGKFGLPTPLTSDTGR